MGQGKQSLKFLAAWGERRKWTRCHAWFLSPEIYKNKLDIRQCLGGRVPPCSDDVGAARSVFNRLKPLETKRELFLNLSFFGGASHLFVLSAACDKIFIHILNARALRCRREPALPDSPLPCAACAPAASSTLYRLPLVPSETRLPVRKYWGELKAGRGGWVEQSGMPRYFIMSRK